jgi:hypothetical protein
MLTLQEQIQEVGDRLQYWEKEVEELAALGQLHQVEDVYQEARGHVNLCLAELTCLQNEMNSAPIKR